ncbi:MAG: SET domain-containing protein [Desulfamplus sp.]|nr:SET domain-containing protein [Desulfamplus sp.]
MKQNSVLVDVLFNQTDKGIGVIAARDFKKGEIVVVGRRVAVLPERTIHSLQMDFDLHVEIDRPGKLINHSCNPNTGVKNNEFGGYNFIAIVHISEGDEITFDYETTEEITEYFSIAVPECLCGCSNCRGKIRGFHSLPPERKEYYSEFIGDYLK